MSPTTGDDSESNNDSAPERPHESLYRRTDGEAEGPSSPTPRHFESALSRPDEAETGFGWLFRPDPQERSVAAEADISTAGRAIPPIPGADRYGQISEATLAGALAPAALPSAEPPAAIPPDAMPPDVIPPKATAATRPAVADRPRGPSSSGPWSPRRRRRWWLWVLIALVVLVVAGLVVFRLFGNGSTEVSSPTNPTTSSSAAPQQSTSGATPYAGSVAAVVQLSAEADCQAPAARDDGGTPVRYAPGNVSDGNPATAWRCDGAAEGSTLTSPCRAPPWSPKLV